MSLPWWIETKGGPELCTQTKRLTASEIKHQLRIHELLRHYGAVAEPPPKGTGWISAPCPFHQDRRPSASINHDLQRFRCHSCDVAGDVIDVVEQVEHLTTKEAMAWIRSNLL